MTWAMRMDHYVKIGDNDIHAAQLVYSLTTIIILIILCTIVIHKSVLRDLKNIELTAITKKTAKDKKRARASNVQANEDEMGLTGA
jgi:hypothetical protein